MIDRYDALAGEIMRMMEDNRGLVRSKLADLLEKEVGAWKPDVSIGMVASASDHSKLSLKAQLMEAHWRECRADAVKQTGNSGNIQHEAALFSNDTLTAKALIRFEAMGRERGWRSE
jgi:hypothetical protein